MDEQPARVLVGVSWMVKRTGLGHTTIVVNAAKGLIPSATKLLGRWRFDPDVIEAWIEAGRPKPQQTTVPAESCYLSQPAPKPEPQHQRAEAAPSNLPLLVLYPDAPWRGISDRPTEKPAQRATASRRRRTRKAALSSR